MNIIKFPLKPYVKKAGIKRWFQLLHERYVFNKHCKERCRNLRNALKMPDYDQHSFYALIALKLENIFHYAVLDSNSYTETWRPDMIRRAIDIAWYLAGDGDFSQDVNMNNITRFIPEYERYKYELNGQWEDKIQKEEFYNIKAKHLLFKIIETYIDFWYDI